MININFNCTVGIKKVPQGKFAVLKKMTLTNVEFPCFQIMSKLSRISRFLKFIEGYMDLTTRQMDHKLNSDVEEYITKSNSNLNFKMQS